MTSDVWSWSRRHQVALFYVSAFALSWGIWGTKIAQQHDVLSFHIPAKLAFFAVAIAAWAVAGIVDGRAGVKDLLMRMVRWRVGAKWYAVAVLVPVVLAFIAAGLYRLAGGDVPLGVEASLGVAAVYLVSNIPFMAVTEETAWRGFALTRLQRCYSPLVSSLFVGLLWGLWHTPLFFMADEAQAGYPYLAFVLFAIAEGVLTAWIYNNTGGSVLLAAVFHSATDAALVYSGVVSGSDALFWLAVAVAWAGAAGAMLYTRKMPAVDPPVMTVPATPLDTGPAEVRGAG